MLRYLLLVSIFIFAGCANKDSFSTTKRFEYISKDAVLEASKKVFRLSNRQNYIVDSYRDGLKVTQVKFKHEILLTDLDVNRWDIDVKQDQNGTDATLQIYTVDALNLNDKSYIHNNKLHEIFWKRVEYFLNQKNIYWTKCNNNLQEISKEYGLCDDTNPLDTKKVKYPYIDQAKQAYKEQEDKNLELLKKSSMSITKSSKEDILDFDKNVIDLEATAKQEENIDENMTEEEKVTAENIDNTNEEEKDDFEKRLDSIINSTE